MECAGLPFPLLPPVLGHSKNSYLALQEPFAEKLSTVLNINDLVAGGKAISHFQHFYDRYIQPECPSDPEGCRNKGCYGGLHP